jgi:hypothetical protein
VVDNLMLYQEGWGVGRIKHSLTYSGGPESEAKYGRTRRPRNTGSTASARTRDPTSRKSPKAFRSPLSRSTTCPRCIP